MSANAEAQNEKAPTGLHRPDAEIAGRPRLKVKRPPKAAGGERGEEEPAAQSPEDGTEQDSDAQQELPRIDPDKGPSPYATHRPPPQDENAEKAELEAVNGEEQAREISSGFLLGIALIVVALIGGILIARMQGKIGALERRVQNLEQAQGGAAP